MKIVLKACMLALGLAVAGECMAQDAAQASQPDVTVLFQRRMEGYSAFRIPALVQTPTGRIIAFAEGRMIPSDSGDIDLSMKYTDDLGKTWSNTRIVWDDKENTCGNPVPVVDRRTGRIILLTTWNRGEDRESQIKEREGLDKRRPHMTYSDDNGLSWSEPVELTNVQRDDWTWYATGPGHAIQLKGRKYRGRIVVPCNHTNFPQGEHRSHVIYSDDGGLTWHLGGVVAQAGGNESTVVELKNGDLMLNMRNKNRERHKCRAYAISKDGGLTWSDMMYDQGLEEPRCQGSILNYNAAWGKPGNVLLFSNPADPDKRINMTIKRSADSGRTWHEVAAVFPGHSAYSDMAVLQNGDVAIFFEHGDRSPYDKMGFAVYPAELFK